MMLDSDWLFATCSCNNKANSVVSFSLTLVKLQFDDHRLRKIKRVRKRDLRSKSDYAWPVSSSVGKVCISREDLYQYVEGGVKLAMRSLLLIATVLVTGALALDGGQVCEPGSNFMVECNKCRCSADGKLMSCTRKFCVPESFQSDDPAPAVAQEPANSGDDGAKGDEEQVHTNGQVCTPNETKQEDCNRCKCAANGIGWFCTRKACPPREKRHASRQNPLQCTPGTSFKSSDGCNDCFCTETGIAACTMKFCFNDAVRSKREAPKLAKQCEPGTSFKSADGCNDCFCTETGITACTMKFCFNDDVRSKREAPELGKQCEPDTAFKSADGCNDCFCTENGIAACTDMECSDNKVKREAPAGTQCVKGTTFKSSDDCNTCFCGDNGVIACTRKFCVPKVKRDVQQQCVPGTTFKDAEGCNDCFCTADGRAACTEKLCLKPQKTKRDAPQPEKECVPGTSFKSADGCNNCFCTENGVAACTQRFCYPTKTKRQVAIGQAVPKMDCVPGTSFKHSDGCNNCYCGEHGIAACTQMFCFPKEKRDVEELPQSKIAPGTEGFECKPNSRFKYQCNQCRCDNTGKFAACTYKFCIEGEY
uniref:Putative serine protease inhibitor i/ii n=2 Tax=Culex tarsalis TaxID=7177 RepID=A0A1Q3FKT5_CULTA